MVMTVHDLLAQAPIPAMVRVRYGDLASQFGDLTIPEGTGPFPVVVLVHGGCWQAEFSLEHLGPFAAALAGAGYAVWSLEYRRVGEPGGGWPGTFQDVAQGLAHIHVLARGYPVDPARLVLMGHSAGGQLVLWAAAGQDAISAFPQIRSATWKNGLRGVIALAGIPDLASAWEQRVCGDAVAQLLGGTPAEWPDRYQAASPRSLLPLGIPQVLLSGAEDEVVPPGLVSSYAKAATMAGDSVRFELVPDCGHYEPVIPYTNAWRVVTRAIENLLAAG